MLFYQLVTSEQQQINQWSGGTTTQLNIYPEGSQYAGRDFSVRISTATVSLTESEFTALAGFKRHIMLLEGEMRLEHKEQHQKQLKQYETDFFDGGWQTNSFGQCTDFNLMLAEGWKGTLSAYETTELNYCSELLVGLYGTASNSVVRIFKEKQKVEEVVLGKHDFMFIPPQEVSDIYQLQIETTEPAFPVICATAWQEV